MSFSKIAKRCIIYLPLALFVTGPLIYVGCSGGVTGDGFRNSPPTVRFTNTPPADEVFTRNVVINWVGSDIDGRIVEYRYTVVLRDSVPAGMSPDQFAQTLPSDTNYANRWISRIVTLDDPANSDVVAMAADFDDPVKTIVEQSVFLYAIDDKGALSRVAYREFGRRNHHPETVLLPFLSPYVNVQMQQFGTGGVPTIWSGSDKLDFPGEDEPPLEFEWKLFGPYSRAESTRIIDNFTKVVFVTTERTLDLGIDTLFDTTFDFTKADTTLSNFDPDGNPRDTVITVAIGTTVTMPVLMANSDTLKALARGSHFDTILVIDSLLRLDGVEPFTVDSITDPTMPDTMFLGIDPPRRTLETSFSPFTGEKWVKDVNTIFLDVFRSDTSSGDNDTTRELTFLFWVRSRDDAFVPDPTPAFGIYNVIEAKHERDLLIVDWNTTSKFKNINGIWMPCSTDSTGGLLDVLALGQRKIKATMSEFITKWGGTGFVGGTNASPFDTGTFDCTEDSSIIPAGVDCSSKRPNFSSPDYMFVQGFGLSQSVNFFAANLRDILKHKVVIYLKDHVQNSLPVKSGSGGETFLVSGVLDGVNFWTMSRAPFLPGGFDALEPEFYGIDDIRLPIIYAAVFGLQAGMHQAWYGMAVQRGLLLEPLPTARNEDFIGTEVSEFFTSAEFPPLRVDPILLRDGLRWVDTTDPCPKLPLSPDSDKHYPFIDSIPALSEVGFTVPNSVAGTRAIYLYKSLYGEQQYPFWKLDFDNYEGTVVAVRRNAGLFRASHWQFTPTTLEPTSFQIAFNSMLDWLFQPWGGPTMGVAPVSPPEARTSPNRELKRLAAYQEQQRRETIREIMPPGQRMVTNQIEFNQYLKEWQQIKQAEAEALEASPFEY